MENGFGSGDPQLNQGGGLENNNQNPPAENKSNKSKKSNEPPVNTELERKLAELQLEKIELEKKLQEKEQAPPAQAVVGINGGMSAEAVEALVRSVLKGTQNGETSHVIEDNEPVGPEDHDRQGTPFYSYMVYNIIASDIRNGQEYAVPSAGTLGKKIIIFNPEFSRPMVSGRQQEVLIISKFVSHSHKLTKWLREYSGYGKTIFEKIGQASTSLNIQHARFIAQTFDWAKSLNNAEIIHQLTERGKLATADPDSNKHELVMAIVNERFMVLPDGRVMDRVSYEDENSTRMRMNSMNAQDILDNKVDSVRNELWSKPGVGKVDEVPDHVRAAQLSNPNRGE